MQDSAWRTCWILAFYHALPAIAVDSYRACYHCWAERVLISLRTLNLAFWLWNLAVSSPAFCLPYLRLRLFLLHMHLVLHRPAVNVVC
jgi:hypothetical protein